MRASYLKILIIVLITSCSLIDDSGEDNDWFWYISIVDPNEKDLFLTNMLYDIEDVGLKTDIGNDTTYRKYEYEISSDSGLATIRYKLTTGNSKELTHYINYQNGDIDTIRVEVEGPSDFVAWQGDRFTNIDKIYFYFNDSLSYTFNIKNNPQLDEEIMNYNPSVDRREGREILNDEFLLRFRKRSVVTGK